MVISGGEQDYGYSFRDLHVHKASASRVNSQPAGPSFPLWYKHKNIVLIRPGASVSAPLSFTKHHITPTFSVTLLLSDAAIGAGTPRPLPSSVTHSPNAPTPRTFAHQFSHVISNYCSWMCLSRSPCLEKMFSKAQRRSWEQIEQSLRALCRSRQDKLEELRGRSVYFPWMC